MSSPETWLAARLAEGPIPAAEVMAQALYHPDWGYYRRPEAPWDFQGKDYYTALDLGPLLGQALARRLQSAWERLDRPPGFTVLEPGAGRGWLGRDLLNAAEGPFREALRYLHRDDNHAARAAAAEALAPWLTNGQARMMGESEPLEPFTGAVLSNELFDALPAQPWRWDGTRWVREILTATGPEWQAAGDGEALPWFELQAEEAGGLEPGDGSVWCAAMPAVVRELSTPLQAGLFLAIDYGESTSRLLAKGADLRRFVSHTVDGEWWRDLGQSDLTADVDFTRLQLLLENEGWTEVGQGTLSHWIRTHAPLLEWEAAWLYLDPKLRVKRMENLLQLTMPGLMGDRFRVLEAWK